MPRKLSVQRAFEMIANTARLEATGHSIGCAPVWLPVGLTLIGRPVPIGRAR